MGAEAAAGAWIDGVAEAVGAGLEGVNPYVTST